MVDGPDNFPTLRWHIRRWSLRHIWYRLHLPVRRRRWIAEDRRRLAPYPRACGASGDAPGAVVAVGDFSRHSGLARAAQYERERLLARHPDLISVDLAKLFSGSCRTLLPAAGAPVRLLYLLCQPDSYAAAFGVFEPAALQDARRIGMVVWENDQFPGRWKFSIPYLDEIWTPSEFSAGALRKGAEIPVVVRPHPVTVDRKASPLPRDRFNVPDDAFLGIAIMDIESCPERKNPWAHVVAWKKAFGDDASKVLLMKLRVGKRTRMVVDELNELAGNAGNIKVTTNEFDATEMACFQKMADVYLSLHRSEGFGLIIKEMLSLGVPVVATNWSANVEFGDQYANYYGVSYQLKKYRDWMNQYPGPAFEWAEADTENAAAILRGIAKKERPRYSAIRGEGVSAGHGV